MATYRKFEYCITCTLRGNVCECGIDKREIKSVWLSTEGEIPSVAPQELLEEAEEVKKEPVVDELAEFKNMQEWLPMNIVPTNKAVLLYLRPEDNGMPHIVVGRFKEGEGWTDIHGHRIYNPMHWMCVPTEVRTLVCMTETMDSTEFEIDKDLMDRLNDILKELNFHPYLTIKYNVRFDTMETAELYFKLRDYLADKDFYRPYNDFLEFLCKAVDNKGFRIR